MKAFIQRYTFLAILLAFTMIVGAKPVDTLIAKRVAVHFMQGITGADVNSQRCDVKMISAQRGINSFYVINVGKGYVIVSADDRIEPILGYSTEGNFDPQNIPENMLGFLNDYQDEILYFINLEESNPNATSKWHALYESPASSSGGKGVVVGPLLETNWDQNYPYNNSCPTDSNAYSSNNYHVYAGCVATAMAQVIRYWQYPSQGVGSKSYVCNNSSDLTGDYGDYGTLSVNFASGSYNYANMPTSINQYSSSTNISAIAKLIYHCAVSVEMEFGPYYSSAYTSDAANALRTYFKYSTSYGSENPSHKNKSSYTENNWKNLIRGELDQWKPIIYHGSGSGGHAFVCDGYDSQGYYHFNWGWSGSYNGYFSLSALMPGTTHNYTNSQGAIVYIKGLTPLIKANKQELTFLTEANVISPGKRIDTRGIALSSSITATVSGNFQVSTDSVHYYSSVSLSTTGGTLYVRYLSANNAPATERGTLTLSSSSTSISIPLTGWTFGFDCNAPQNLQVTQDNSEINLTWDAPSSSGGTTTFSWDPTSDPSSYYGYPSTAHTIAMAYRMCDSDLVAYHNKQLTKIGFYPRTTNTSNYKVFVYKGGSVVNGQYSPGTLVAQKNVSSVSSGWNTITLNTPVTIDASQELWYGYQFDAPAGIYCMAVGSASNTYIAEKSDLVQRDNGSWNSFGVGRNFMIRATIQDAPSSVVNYTVESNGDFLDNTTALGYTDIVTQDGIVTYNVTANWSNGCSASSQITVDVIHDCPPVVQDTFVDACEYFSWYGTSYLSTPTEPISFTIPNGAANGCDSIMVLHLTIHHPVTTTETVTACDSYTWNEGTYTNSGVYTKTFTMASGCDSTAILYLTINHSAASTETVTACDSYTWGGQTYTQSGTYIQHLQTSKGCDSIATLHLTINHSASTSETVTACDSYMWGGQKYSQSGTYTQHLVTSTGCDSTVILNLTINYSATSTETVTACDSYTWGGQVYTESGTYTQNLQTSKGCDSIATLHLTINSSAASTETVTACNSYTWGGQIYTQSGTYIQHLQTSKGCDSIATLHLTINHSATSTETVTACDSYTWGGQVYTESGTYIQHLQTSKGCDSIVTLHLSINHSVTTTETVSACETYTWGGQTYTQSGTYTQHLQTSKGCDSIATLHLTINHSAASTETITACDSYTWGGQTYTESGTYTQNLQTNKGCDSIATLHLTINHSAASTETATACDSFDWGGQTYTQSGTYIQNLKTSKGCDSIATLHLTVNHSAITNLEANSCESYTWDGQTYTQSGLYTKHLQTDKGCDSTITLNLTINHSVTDTIEAVSCDSYTWGAITIIHSGTYTRYLQTDKGCDSTITLNITINHSKTTNLNTTACDSYTWGGQTYTQSGTYIQNLQTASGCDSIVTLNLTINHSATSTTSVTACDSYTWDNGQTYTQSGTYTQHLQTAKGCDSTA
nr:C10 family peptidase [Bacteroidales bacterium]